MSKDDNLPTVSNRGQLADLYRVSLRVFNGWIELNAELKKLFEPFTDNNKRTLPPYVVNKVFELLGEP